jgi:deoxyribonuclease IV
MGELLAGAHMSIAGGIHKAFERGRRACCRTIQIFLKNSNQWAARPLTEQDRRLFQDEQRTGGINPVVAHDSYLINLASPDIDLYRKSIDAFIEEMNRANWLGIPCLVLHPGSHMGAGVEAGVTRVANAINQALERVAPPVTILLENTAGQGNSLGCRLEHLAAIIEQIRDPLRVGVCLDTCHLFAAGYDIRTEEGYEKVMREFDHLIGIEKIRVFHVNDSKKDLGCRVDRHCHIGQGCIGLETFRCLVNDRRFANIPKILETPKGPNLQEDIMNLGTLRSLLGRKSKSRTKGRDLHRPR